MTDWAEVGRKIRPTIEYRSSDHYSACMNAISNELNSMGLREEAGHIQAMKNKVTATRPAFVHSVAVEASIVAKMQEREMVGHGRYIPTGNLMRSIGVHEAGNKVEVYPDAVSKDGKTEYGGFVHDGTRLEPIPKPYIKNAYEIMQAKSAVMLEQYVNQVGGGVVGGNIT